MNILKLIGAFVLAYLIGSIPFSQIIASIFRPGTDLKTIGCANCGATNVFLTIGVLPGVLTLLFDMSKGIVAILIVRYWTAWTFSDQPGLLLLTTCFLILGHDYPVWNRFKGGKGLAVMESFLIFFGPVWAVLVNLPQAQVFFQRDEQHGMAIANLFVLLMFPAMALLWFIESKMALGWLGWDFTHMLNDPIKDPAVLSLFSLIWGGMFFIQRVVDNPGVVKDVRKGIPLGRAVCLRGLYEVFPQESDYQHPSEKLPMKENVLKK